MQVLDYKFGLKGSTYTQENTVHLGLRVTTELDCKLFVQEIICNHPSSFVFFSI